MLISGYCLLSSLVHFLNAQERSPDEAVVYPRFLDGRSEDGVRVLKITNDLMLNVVRKPAYRGHLLLRTTENDGTHHYEHVSASSYNKHLYLDRGNLASLVVREQDGLQVNGIIGEDVRIKPLFGRERAEEGRMAHLLYREEQTDNNARIMDYVVAPVSRTADSHGPRLEQRAYSNDKIAVETHVVIDSTYFMEFKCAKDDIIIYFGAVLNAINIRYETVTDIKVQIFITGFTFNRNNVDEPYITRVSGRSQYGHITKTLSGFMRHYFENGRKYTTSSADVMVLVTGLDLCTIEGNEFSCNSAGVAYTATACNKYKYAVCEDKPYSYGIVRVMAHELAHVLGCVHDGEGPSTTITDHPGAESCPWGHGFLMSYVQNGTNEFRFSTCCSRQIKFVATLKGRECLRRNNTGKVMPSSSYLPGSNISLDMLCEQTFNRTGYRFRHDRNETLVGCKVPCIMQYSDRGNIYVGKGNATAQDGSICDMSNYNKICILGECQRDNRFTRRIHRSGYKKVKKGKSKGRRPNSTLKIVP